MGSTWISKASGNTVREIGETAIFEARTEDRHRRQLAASPHTKPDAAQRAALAARRPNLPYVS